MIKTVTPLKSCRLFYPARTLPSNTPGSTPLTIAKLLVIDDAQQDVELISVLGFPSDIKPGVYDLEVEVRAKSGKAGINYWYISAQTVQK